MAVSPYLTRPIRTVEEVERLLREERLRQEAGRGPLHPPVTEAAAHAHAYARGEPGD
jgi:hypothetical protein